MLDASSFYSILLGFNLDPEDKAMRTTEMVLLSIFSKPQNYTITLSYPRKYIQERLTQIYAYYVLYTVGGM